MYRLEEKSWGEIVKEIEKEIVREREIDRYQLSGLEVHKTRFRVAEKWGSECYPGAEYLWKGSVNYGLCMKCTMTAIRDDVLAKYRMAQDTICFLIAII